MSAILDNGALKRMGLLNDFKLGGWAAVYMAGTKEVVPRYMGDNRGGVPIRFGVVTSFQDSITKDIDRSSPFYWHGVLARCWVQGKDAAYVIEEQFRELILKNSDDARRGYRVMEPDDSGRWNHDRAFRSLRDFVEEWSNPHGHRDGQITFDDRELIAYLKWQKDLGLS